jgi:hypothetical protein
MSTIPEMALLKAKRLELDLGVSRRLVPTDVFHFDCLEPKSGMLRAFRQAKAAGHDWVEGMPIPVLTYQSSDRTFRIMDGMLRICSARKARIKEFPALVASGDTYDALEDILRNGYYGEDFIEMLAMVNPLVRENLEMRRRRFLSGK